MQETQWDLIKVLVVDDDQTTRDIMKTFIEKIGCIGVFAENGQKAVDILKKHHFDLCFMDIMMPVMGGVKATQIIREEINAEIPIVAITASTMKSDRQLCEDVGMNDYIQKPLQIQIIKDKISHYTIQGNSLK
jgi:CheY-like chemotaxis protein